MTSKTKTHLQQVAEECLAEIPPHLRGEVAAVAEAMLLGPADEGDVWVGTGYEFCGATTGHNKTWPEWANDVCPRCGQEFRLSDVVVALAGEIVHYDCLT